MGGDPGGRGRGELIEFDEEAGRDRDLCFLVDEGRCSELYRLVIPGQAWS